MYKHVNLLVILNVLSTKCKRQKLTGIVKNEKKISFDLCSEKFPQQRLLNFEIYLYFKVSI